MKYKVISTDFDGTLLNKKKKITEKNKKALLKYKSEKSIIIGITARNLSSVKRVCDIKLFDYLILNNGGYLYNVEKEEGEYLDKIEEKIVNKITKYFKKQKVEEIDYISAEKYYIYRPQGQKDFRDFVVHMEKFTNINDFISRINIFASNNEKVLEYKRYIDNNFPEVDSIIMQDTDNGNNKIWIAINPKGLNKYTTLKKWCDKMNIKLDEIIFFGDSSNDLEIIQNVGLGVAMANALPKVKEKAKKVTLSNEEDGLAYFLEEKL